MNKKDAGFQPLEHRCATQRMMTAVAEAWKLSEGTLSQNALGRAISSEDLRFFAHIAKKYV